MKQLIELLENARRPDESLDNAIAEAIGWSRRWITDPDGDLVYEWVNQAGKGFGLYASGCCILGRVTGSIDDALGLVPKGAAWMVRRSQPWDRLHPYHAAYVQLSEADEFSASAETPEIALCIAALRAWLHTKAHAPGSTT